MQKLRKTLVGQDQSKAESFLSVTITLQFPKTLSRQLQSIKEVSFASLLTLYLVTYSYRDIENSQNYLNNGRLNF